MRQIKQSSPSRITWMFLCIVALCLAMVSCQSQDAGLTVLRIGHAPHDHHSPLFIAALNPSYFKKNGEIYLQEVVFRKEYRLISHGKPIADVTIDSVTGGKELIRKLHEEYFDISFGGVPAILHFIDQGADLKILSPVMAEGAGFAVRADLPFDDWDGFLQYVRRQDCPFRVGYKMAVSVQNIIFEKALQSSKISFGRSLDERDVQVQLLNLYGAKNLPSALSNGLIDGFVVMQPYLAQAKRDTKLKIVAMLSELPPNGNWKGHPCCALAANSAYLDTHPEESTAMLTLLMRANRYIREYPSQSALQISKWLGTSPDVEADALGTIRFGVDFNDDWNRGVHHWVQIMIDSGDLKDRVKRMFETDQTMSQIYAKDIYDRAKRTM